MAAIKNWEQADRAMQTLSRLHAEWGLAQKNMEVEIARVRELCALPLKRLQGECEEIKRELTAFGKAHKREFKSREEGGDKRSYEHADVNIGYQLDPPKVRIEDEDRAIEWMIGAGYLEFVRTRLEPNREALREALSNDADPLVEKFAAHGITLQQKDRFFIEVKDA